MKVQRRKGGFREEKQICISFRRTSLSSWHTTDSFCRCLRHFFRWPRHLSIQCARGNSEFIELWDGGDERNPFQFKCVNAKKVVEKRLGTMEFSRKIERNPAPDYYNWEEEEGSPPLRNENQSCEFPDCAEYMNLNLLNWLSRIADSHTISIIIISSIYIPIILIRGS